MQIKLPSDIFPVLPGTQWVDPFNILFLTEEHGRKVIKYGFSYFSSLYCAFPTEEGFVADDQKTVEVFPLLLEYLAKHINDLKNLDFGPEEDKIAKIKYVRKKYDLGLKEAKDMVEGEGLPSVLKVWELPHTNFPCEIPLEEGDRLAVLEDKGIFPVSLLQQKHLQPILDWQGGLTDEDVEVTKVYLFINGAIKAIAPEVIYSHYKHHTVVKVENLFIPNEDLLIGVYASIEEAKSHYAAFQLGVEKASQAYKSKLETLASEWEPRF